MVAVDGAIVYVGYRMVVPSKKKKIAFLIENNYSQGTPNVLSGFEDDFVAAWYKAAKAKDDTFNYNGKNYKTIGGRAV